MTWFDEYEAMPVPLDGFRRDAPQYEGVGLLRALARHADVERKRTLQRRRGGPLAHENYPPRGQAAAWYESVIGCVPPSGQRVAHALARLCDLDSFVTVSYRSLADAVGRSDRIGRDSAYARGGVDLLVSAGWLRVETIGEKRGAVTTFYLLPGDLDAPQLFEDDGPDMQAEKLCAE